MSLDAHVDRARRLLASIEKNHSPSVLASSFGAEDMVVLDLIARDGLAIGIFTLDTGRLPLDRLRAVHPRGEAGRASSRGPLVVGERRRAQGVRLA